MQPQSCKPPEGNSGEQRTYTVSEAARVLRVHPRSLRDWIQKGRLRARFEGGRYVFDEAVISALRARQDRVLAWDRLVDVSRRLGIHRNLGESLCRSAGFAIEKDLTDDYRIPPEAIRHLESCIEANARQQGWTRLSDLANELGLPRNVLDGGIRQQGLELGYDHSGQITLPPASCDALRAWRQKLELANSDEAIVEGRRVYSLCRTAAEAAEKFAIPGSTKHRELTETLIARYRYWIAQGLPTIRLVRQRFFDEATHRALVDDITLLEASRLTGISHGRLKHWAATERIVQTEVSPTRRSFSFGSVLSVIAEELGEKAPPQMGVRSLPSWRELGRRLRLPNGVSLRRWLILAAGASLEELHALESGAGFVSAKLWRMVTGWLRAIEAGRRPPKRAIDSPSHHDELIRAPELATLLSWFSGLDSELFGDILWRGMVNRAQMQEVCLVCDHLIRGGAVRPYEPLQAFNGGELLLDPNGCDLGMVQRRDVNQIRVDWMRRGTLTMRHRTP